MEEVYGSEFKTKAQQQDLFVNLKMALTDIILTCERKTNSNLDVNLINIVYNTEGINEIFKEHKIEKIFFTSRFVESLFSKQFRDIIQKNSDLKLVCLPSPSPRYALLSRAQKIEKYKQLLPRLF